MSEQGKLPSKSDFLGYARPTTLISLPGVRRNAVIDYGLSYHVPPETEGWYLTHAGNTMWLSLARVGEKSKSNFCVAISFGHKIINIGHMILTARLEYKTWNRNSPLYITEKYIIDLLEALTLELPPFSLKHIIYLYLYILCSVMNVKGVL